MIEVQDLTKTFGERTAVDHISFAVNKGEILGFLGPNGAGKTTTMRMITSFMPATSGTARIAGFDVFDDSLEVRRHIGYLPENPPVYPDMTVESYLDFVARIKGVPAEKRAQRVTDALEKTNITDKRDELIKRLSRGYKQRVGLAQALVHDPDVIILDEPTVGLDPKQIIEVRHLIKNLGREPHDHSLHAHPARSEHDLRPRGHHQQRQNRSRRYAAESHVAAEGRAENSRGSAGIREAAARICLTQDSGRQPRAD